MFMGALSSVQCLFLHYKHILNIRSLNNSLSGSIAHICCGLHLVFPEAISLLKQSPPTSSIFISL